jgi:hypothetical protein
VFIESVIFIERPSLRAPSLIIRTAPLWICFLNSALITGSNGRAISLSSISVKIIYLQVGWKACGLFIGASRLLLLLCQGLCLGRSQNIGIHTRSFFHK